MGRRGLFLLLLATLAVQLAAGIGLAALAGFSAVYDALGRFSWPWLFAIVAALAVSFLGYYLAYRGTFGHDLEWSLADRHMVAVALAGFGGFLAHGATALDVAALRAGGADERETAVRVSAFSGLEYGVLAVGGCGAAITALVLGLEKPPPDFTLPWAIIPLPGFLLAFWLARRYGERLSREGGLARRLGIFLESIEVVRGLFAKPWREDPAVIGMALFWAGDALAAWCGMAAFGEHMEVAQLIVGFATGMVFTRRSGPLAGEGILAVVLPVTIWYSGSPLAVAVPGVFVYHFLSLWLPTPFSLAQLGTLREVVQPGMSEQSGQSGTVNGAK